MVGGYYLIEAPDLHDAMRLAALLPEPGSPYRAGVEIRRVMDRG
ncbi:hypothetical protein ACI3ET_10705 [Ornithinimicrobium sp. LYQ121]